MEKNKYLQVRENNFTNQEEGYQMSGDKDTNDKKWKTKGEHKGLISNFISTSINLVLWIRLHSDYPLAQHHCLYLVHQGTGREKTVASTQSVLSEGPSKL